ncbi:hypothetical protein TBR22_A04140 [Luteitalea sp. TBR-22]|uniref:hypothetical protein n=1 Tax=Luteitalea sp. TBR-22 TaxID=2802971 RepID=UPI001AF95653|nr:hypothetical protein [Luteitalea sp. TBR-22]BCS31214.1 hypothetical protein TBR22_A04140 [Luteitalea sp. TBR-22]
MRTVLLRTLALLGSLVVAASALAAGSTPGRAAWVSGMLVRVDAAGRLVEVRQGNRELPFTLTRGARILRGDRPLSVADLQADVGEHVRIRYTATTGTRLADRVEVLDPHAAPRP